MLLKPTSLAGERSPFTVFEYETIRYAVDDYEWRRNANGNFEGYDKRGGEHKFTWQRHGSQFTIKEAVPTMRLRFFVKKPPTLDDERVLKLIGFDPSWIEIVEG